MNLRIKRAVALAFAAALLLPPAAASAEEPVDVFFREGAEASRAGNVPLAYEKFRAAWALKQTYDIAANLGFAELALGKKRDAAEHLEFALRNFPPMGDTSQRSALEQKLEEVRKEVGELTISSATGAAIEVNGTVVGTCPLPGRIFVEPGQQIIVAKKPGVGEGKIVVSVRVGEAQEVRVELILSKDDKQTPSNPRPTWPGFAGLGVGAAGIGVGIAGFVLMAQKQSEMDEIAVGMPAGSCFEANPACDEIQDGLDTAASFRSMGIAGVVIGGAAAIFGTIYLSAPNPGTEESATAQIQPWFGPGTGGVSVSGTF
ncbi:MAG: hypothetical protein HOW73_41120 [Polyangiaceae bacterium]|nr:hypothetical protein [Polyangiaceae bacterium]